MKWPWSKPADDRWIPVSERLPDCPPPSKIGVPVLVWPREPSRLLHCVDGHAYYGRRTGKPTFYKFGLELDQVTHWMPMPEGPK